MSRSCFRFLVWTAVGLFTAAPVSAQEPFYKGKTIRIIVGLSPGGGFDTYSRTIARHLGKHIPGEPAVVVDNMPGAGGLISANHLYNVARPDGLTIANFVGSLLLGRLYGQPGIDFDAHRFEYIGMPARTSPVCALTRASGITSLEKWMASNTPVKLGGVTPGSETDDIPKVLRATLGLPLQVVTGYKGTANIRLAAESGEVAGGCWSWDSVKVTWARAIESGDAVVVLQALPRPHPDLPAVPLAINLAKTDEARQLIKAAAHDPATIYRPYVLPPGTPKERVQILRRAFHATLADPAFLAEAAKSRLTVDPVGGEDLERTVAALFKLSPQIIAKLKEIILAR